MPDRYDQYVAHYKANPHLGWTQCQKEVDASLDRAPSPPNISTAYMKTLDPDERLHQVYQYSRSGLDLEQAAELCGEQLMDKPVTLDASGLAFTPQAELYERRARKDPDLASAFSEMMRAAADDGFTPDELAHLQRLLHDGVDPASAYVRVCEGGMPHAERERRRPRPLNPNESQPATPQTHTSGEGGLDADFVKDLGTEILSSGPSQTGPYDRSHIPGRSGAGSGAPTAKHKGDAGHRSQSITRPEPGALTPTGYQREPVYYQRGGLSPEENFCRRFGCTAIAKRPSGDGGEIWEPA
jgi:hypothetical protein